MGVLSVSMCMTSLEQAVSQHKIWIEDSIRVFYVLLVCLIMLKYPRGAHCTGNWGTIFYNISFYIYSKLRRNSRGNIRKTDSFTNEFHFKIVIGIFDTNVAKIDSITHNFIVQVQVRLNFYDCKHWIVYWACIQLGMTYKLQ